MNRFTLTALLIVCCLFTVGYALTNGVAKAETIRGKIAMDLPDASAPKMVINLDKTFFNLLINFGVASIPKSDGDPPTNMTAYTEYADMLKGAAVRAYDKETEDLNQIVDRYQGILADEKWEHIVKVTDKFNLSLLYAEEPGILHGIFVTIIDDESWSFVNIYGEINFQKLGALFGRVMASSSEEGMSKTIRDLVNSINPEGSDEAPKLETETNDPSNKEENQ
ncbi:MAG: DUF4252 domain-containing protein [Candidatus Poribacteria bacterium]|nr:DUF4252 domain-containing protein [Candidatus Poribacteria bacterium]